MIFLYLSEGMENCKMSGKSGKSQGILRWKISGNPVLAFSPISESILVMIYSTLIISRLKYLALRL